MTEPACSPYCARFWCGGGWCCWVRLFCCLGCPACPGSGSPFHPRAACFLLGSAGAWLGVSVARTFSFSSIRRQRKRARTRLTCIAPPAPGPPHRCDGTAPAPIRNKQGRASAKCSTTAPAAGPAIGSGVSSRSRCSPPSRMLSISPDPGHQPMSSSTKVVAPLAPARLSSPDQRREPAPPRGLVPHIHQTWVPHPRRAPVFAARMGYQRTSNQLFADSLIPDPPTTARHSPPSLRLQRLRHNRHIRDSRLLHRVHHAGEGPERNPLIAAQVNRLVRRVHSRLVQRSARSCTLIG